MDIDIFKKRGAELEYRIERMGNRQKGFVAVDGIINPEIYRGEPVKILWICKEPNSKEGENWYYRHCYNDYSWMVKNKGTAFYTRLIYTTWGILNGKYLDWYDYPDLSDPADHHALFSSLQRIAYINIKKHHGQSRADDKKIREHYLINRDILRSQIELVDADIVIFGNTLKYFDREDFPVLHGKEPYITPMRNHFYFIGNKIFINAWHPAYFKISVKDYVTDIVDNIYKGIG